MASKLLKNFTVKYSQSLISLSKVGVKQNDRWLIRNIDLNIIRGEIITLIGPNGSGKSTTAKTALGILSPIEGKVKRHPNIKIAYVPQKFAIDHTLPLNVSRMMKLTGPIDHNTADQALEEVGMLHMRNAEIGTLSGGELQRILLARAWARNPDLLVLDEPLQGIDFSEKNSLYCLINIYRERLNCGILLISHDLHIVMPSSIWVLYFNGHICYSGKPKDVAESSEYANLFGNTSHALCGL
ncbi:MAG: zinc transport system ATP-binding protein [Candidatus Tokpelaia sp. JSC188]|nr:MAG: zinc transport system ATP-binding protein [Candidatus Tokpelaia sp. JSC188]